MSRPPYKYLDYYTCYDADLYFGREVEVAKTVGEILTSRLLVLFAPSGSGKTSLINAGVRPSLEEEDYETLYCRPEGDPIAAIRRAVEELPGARSLSPEAGLSETISVARRLRIR